MQDIPRKGFELVVFQWFRLIHGFDKKMNGTNVD